MFFWVVIWYVKFYACMFNIANIRVFWCFTDKPTICHYWYYMCALSSTCNLTRRCVGWWPAGRVVYRGTRDVCASCVPASYTSCTIVHHTLLIRRVVAVASWRRGSSPSRLFACFHTRVQRIRIDEIFIIESNCKR